MSIPFASRPYSLSTSLALERDGVHPVLARLFSARGVKQRTELQADATRLLAPDGLYQLDRAALTLADVLSANAKIVVVADYDCDGATACVVALRGLRAIARACGFSPQIDYVVPNRFTLGYGLTPEVVALAAVHPRVGKPDLIITVDNGIASLAGVAAANAVGIEVLVTDHHLPGDALPEALIINPNQPRCDFESKHLSGVGVMFYTLLGLRQTLRARNAFKGTEPNLSALLDLVALGTVADLVKLDANNRILVALGLKRLREGRASAGVQALFTVAARDLRRAQATDFGFAAGPRLNAAGRLNDMSLGIECLLEDDAGRALAAAQKLDTLNRERRGIESEMKEEAFAALDLEPQADRYSACLFDARWHQGVVGIVASRVKEKLNRPAIVFAPGEGDELKGSGRSIGALHLRDCLDLVTKRHPQLIKRFGGHAMAAGLTIARDDLEEFSAAFEAAAHEMLKPDDLAPVLFTDGPLENAWFNLDFTDALDAQVWGQGFAAPVFDDVFQVTEQRLVKDKHTKLKLMKNGRSFDAIRFNATEALPPTTRLAYRLQRDEFNGMAKVSLIVEGTAAAAS